MPEVFKLRNGITVACDERPGTDAVVFEIFFPSGSTHESADEHGLTKLTIESCFGGTQTKDRAALAKILEKLATKHQSGTGRGSSIFMAQGTRDNAPSLFALMSEILIEPAFNPAEIARTREIHKLELVEINHQPEEYAEKSYLETCFPGQSLGRYPDGDPALVDSFTPGQIREKHARLLANTEEIVIVATGDITTAQLRELVEKNWAALVNGTQKKPTPDAALTSGENHEKIDGANIYARLGFPAPALRDDDRFVYTVLAQYLSGSFQGPLFQEVREKRGLAYQIGSDIAALEKAGVFTITATTEPKNARALLETTFKTLREVAENGVDAELFETTKRAYCELHREGNESLFGSAMTLATVLGVKDRAVPIEEKLANIMNVTPQQVQAACAALLKSDVLVSAAAGPVEDYPSYAEILAMKNAAAAGLPSIAVQPYKTVPPMTAETAQGARKGDRIHETVLPNGITVITIERPGTIHACACIGTGSNNDPEGKDGLKHAIEHMVFKQTRSFGKGEAIALLEGKLGAMTNAHTSHEHVSYEASLLTRESLPVAIKVLGEMALAPKFDEEDFSGGETALPDGSVTRNEGERGAILTEIAMYDDMPDEILTDLAHKVIYGEQPHGRQIAGPQETVRTITVADMLRHQQEYHVPNDTVFAVVGPVDHEEIVRHVTENFGGMAPVAIAKPAAPVFLERAEFTETEKCDNTRFELIFEGVGANHPDLWPLEALGLFIGNGEASRLSQRLVTSLETPLVSEIGISSANNTNYGNFSFNVVTEAENLRQVLSTIREELVALPANLTEEDVQDAKDYLKAAISNGYISNRKCLYAMAVSCVKYGKIIAKDDLLREIEETVTRENILAAASRLSNVAAAFVVPTGTDPALIPGIDEIKAMFKNATADIKRKPAHDASNKRQGP